MKTLNSLQEVSEALNQKYAKISDFETCVTDDTVKGGFYKMSYYDRIAGNGKVEYFFHETFGRVSPKYNVNNYNELFSYLEENIQRQLKWQKNSDELYAKEFDKPVQFKFDYSLID